MTNALLESAERTDPPGLAEGRLGRIYHCRVFYGNGTARLVRESGWRDAGAGVLPDLGSHLLDALRFWFGDVADDFRVVQASRFENKAPDRAFREWARCCP